MPQSATQLSLAVLREPLVGPRLVGTVVADLGIRYFFAAFAAVVALVGGVVTLLFAIETRGRVLEELSP